MRYYLWPHGCEKRLRHFLERGKVDLDHRMPHKKDMAAGDVAYFYVTHNVWIVAFATLVGSSYSMPADEVMDDRFSLAVDLQDIHYINPPVKCHWGKGKVQGSFILLEPLPLLTEITIHR